MRRDSATFREKGTEVPSLSWDKGTTKQAKNLAKGWNRPGQPKFEMGRTGTGRWTKRDRAEMDALKQENFVLKQKMMSSNKKGTTRPAVPVCPRTSHGPILKWIIRIS